MYVTWMQQLDLDEYYSSHFILLWSTEIKISLGEDLFRRKGNIEKKIDLSLKEFK